MFKHGHSKRDNGRKSPEYSSWHSMLQRCVNPNSDAWMNYGGRGIKVCERWRHSFTNFLADMGNRPSKNHSLDRIDNNGDYTPANTRWAIKSEQVRNQRRNVMLTAHGKTQCIKDWARELGVAYPTLKYRIANGVPIEEALTSKRFERNAIRPKRYGIHCDLLTGFGRTQNLSEWSREIGISTTALRYRLNKGLTLEEAAQMAKYKHIKAK